MASPALAAADPEIAEDVGNRYLALDRSDVRIYIPRISVADHADDVGVFIEDALAEEI
jgi:hypothetical protein